MMVKAKFLVLLTVISISVSAQLHLGQSTTEVVSTLGTDNTQVFDEKGNQVIAYVNDVKDHPKFGNYTLYNLYIFENNRCIMQETLIPLAQKQQLAWGFDNLYEKVKDGVWKSKEGVYYVLSAEKENLRMLVMKEDVYKREKQ
jgi:hypothetical protein